MSQNFKLVSPFKPAGDQPEAIDALMKNLQNKDKHQILLGATGTGKTFTIAKIVEKINKPTLVIAHNKTLTAQLCSEFQDFFPDNAISYFVSYYDYYQPEAYIAKTDTYIEKEATINEEINKFRHQATHNLLTRKDVLIVASVSAIYGLGNVTDYEELSITLKVNENKKRDKLLRHLTDLQYIRSHLEFKQSMFHVLGDIVEIFPPSSDNVIRIEFFGDEIEAIQEVDSFTGEIIQELQEIKIFPAKHNVTTREKIEQSIASIKKDLKEQYKYLRSIEKNLEAERLKTRTEYDIEMLLETGYCNGIENYVRYLNLREPGEQPATLMDYFPDDFLLIVDESHMTIPQIGAMYSGNLSRKESLINYGFRLPSCLDNRPLKFEEFENHIDQAVYASATPGKYEIKKVPKNKIVEQIIRPTGLIDPVIKIKPSKHQIDDLLNNIHERVNAGERILITTLTKKSSEELTEFLKEADIKVSYLHSEIETLDRIEILRSLRTGEIDVVVGINLLREGLDLPEVSLVVILDADKRGFLRSRDALLQTIGRTARNINGTVIMYADNMTEAMQQAIDETSRRRKIQTAFNKKHNITPQTIIKKIKDITEMAPHAKIKKHDANKVKKEEIGRLISELEAEMEIVSMNLEFEKAAQIRDEIDFFKKMQ